MIHSKKALEIQLSKLKTFDSAKVREEQYPTPSSIAAEILWSAHLKGHLTQVLDIGCGTGILGIGAALLGAQVTLIEKDTDAAHICSENIAALKSEYEIDCTLLTTDALCYTTPVECVVMNPPFGTKQKHADRELLKHALSLSKVTYSFHKQSTNMYISQFGQKHGFIVAERFDFSYLLHATMKFHQKAKQYIKVSCFCFVKQETD